MKQQNHYYPTNDEDVEFEDEFEDDVEDDDECTRNNEIATNVSITTALSWVITVYYIN